MPGRQAKTIAPTALNSILRHVGHHADSQAQHRLIALL